MAIKVEKWQSNRGGLFDTQFDALCADFSAMLFDANPIEQEAINKIVAFFASDTERLKNLAAIIKQLSDAHPERSNKDCDMQSACRPPHIHDFQPVRGEQLARCTVCNQQQLPFPASRYDKSMDPNQDVGNYRG